MAKVRCCDICLKKTGKMVRAGRYWSFKKHGFAKVRMDVCDIHRDYPKEKGMNFDLALKYMAGG